MAARKATIRSCSLVGVGIEFVTDSVTEEEEPDDDDDDDENFLVLDGIKSFQTLLLYILVRRPE